MSAPYRDLRYVRVPVPGLEAAETYATDVLGLMLESRTEDALYFRSDARNHSICFCTGTDPASIALTVATRDELEQLFERFTAAGHSPAWLSDEDAGKRQVKTGVTVAAPNGVMVDFVWRPLTSGWPFHAARPAGVNGLQAVQMACTDIAANESFWTETVGGTVSDWAGQAAFVNLDGAHHRVALYPSEGDGLLGLTLGVEDIDCLMRNWYFLQGRQLPVVHGPGCQPTSGARFVTTKGAGDILYSFATRMDGPPEGGPRQFPDVAQSHCAWNSPSTIAEFMGGTEQ